MAAFPGANLVNHCSTKMALLFKYLLGSINDGHYTTLVL